jgi:hypothetical protein
MVGANFCSASDSPVKQESTSGAGVRQEGQVKRGSKVITAIFILIALATLHFVYESILAPSLRLSLRFRLFVLRDETRQLKIDCASSLSDKHFDFLQDSINNLISNLNRFDMATFVGVEFESKKDPSFLKTAEERSRILDDCNIPRAREIRKQSLKIICAAIFINSVPLFLLICAPITIAILGYAEVKRRIRILAFMSDQDLQRIPVAGSAAASPT